MITYIHLGNKANERYDKEIAKSILRNGDNALVLIDPYKNGVVKAIASNLKKRFPESNIVDKEYLLTGLDVIALTVDGVERKVVVNTLDSMISWNVMKNMGLSFGSVHIISEWIYECGVKGIGVCANFNELSEAHVYCRTNRPYESSISVMKQYASLAEKTEFSYDFEIIDELDTLRYERGDYEICRKCEYGCSVSINDVIDYICDVKRRMTTKDVEEDGHFWITLSDTAECSRCIRGQDGVVRTYITKDCPYYAEQFIKGIQNEKKENEKC